MKRVRSIDLHKDNAVLFESFIVRAARINPISFPIAAQILINLKHKGHKISYDRIVKLIFDTIRKTSIIGRHGELSWALFLAKGLGIKIPGNILSETTKVESSVCALIILDLRNIGLISGNIDTTFWESFMNQATLRDNMWLLAYEADIKGWLPSPHNHVENDPYFKVLKSRKVFFYDEKKNVQTFRKAIRTQMAENERKLSSFNMLKLMMTTNFQSI